MTRVRCLKLGYRCYGDPCMPPLILLMGLAMPALAWPEELIRYLVRQGLYVVTVENRDVGTSERGECNVSNSEVVRAGLRCLMGKSVQAPYSVEDMAGDVIGVMDELHIDRAHIAGVSMGGMIAQSLACKAPHRVISLICLSTSSGNPRMMLGSMGGIVSILKSAVGKRGSKDDEARRMAAFFRAIGTPGEERSGAEIASLMAMCSAKGINQETVKRHLLAVFAGGDRRKRLAQLCVPTLVIHGTKDRLLPFKAGQELASVIRGAELVAVKGMGHDLPKSHIKTLGEAIVGHCYSYDMR